MIGIYKIVSPSGRVYVGQSVNISNRFKSYRYNKCKAQLRLYRSFVKYGLKEHKFIIIEECNINLLNERERYWQDYYQVLGKRGLNCKLTGFRDKSGKLSNGMINKLIGSKRSEQQRANMRLSHLGTKRSIEHKESISKAIINRFKCSKSRKKQGVKMCKPVVQCTILGEFVKEWESIREIERVTGIDKGMISKCCNGKGYYKTVKGYIWRYKLI